MEECPFCKIAAGEVPALKVYEDNATVAFLDINPCSPGHTVVVPRRHIKMLEEMSPEAVKALFDAVATVAPKVKRALGAGGLNIGLNDGEAAGQVLPHVHVHIIPRYKDDKGGSMHSIVRIEVKKEMLPKIAEKIKAEFGRVEEAPEEEERVEKPEAEAKKPAKPKKKEKWYFFYE